MLVCYLDDSGKDPQNQCTAIAGYIARDTAWRAFEADVERWFTEFNVDILHATDLQGTRGAFGDWTVLRKQAFVARVCQARNPHVMLGMSMAAQKAPYEASKVARGRKRTASPYAFCFNTVLNWVLTDVRTGGAAHTEGVRFILECGHENNADAARLFHEIREKYGLHDTLQSICFAPKGKCRAIQLADLLAFYSRRGAERSLKARQEGTEEYAVETMERILTAGAPHRGLVATDFGDDAVGSRFLGGHDY